MSYQTSWKEQTTLVSKLKPNLPKTYLERVGREIVRTIKERTLKGVDKDGVDFEGYSESYINSKEFLIARKSPSNVNLKMSGEMLADLQVLHVDAKKGEIHVGFRDHEAIGKAHGHITGADGNLPVRDFLGVTEKEIATILSKVPVPQKLLDAEQILQERVDTEKKKIESGTVEKKKGGFFMQNVIAIMEDLINSYKEL